VCSESGVDPAGGFDGVEQVLGGGAVMLFGGGPRRVHGDGDHVPAVAVSLAQRERGVLESGEDRLRELPGVAADRDLGHRIRFLQWTMMWPRQSVR
jgi:hypothetical protein